ncbi:LysR family transcriptional regulator [Pandoraea sp.]|uniref:LysR family transcriptional regulator n=1 Tax=Pandoraea sp. TaxID=1883445 RepID=UPI001209998E|nr:LysR family transcriptional regulator [Pandoraea sp.]TAL53291.1 MAG: LysR family transcriptional regulator [Pandoraea sp.]TAM16658.1 MAG: LysR family transcriptional regulator [Pandoraea sp.]
MAIDEAVTLKKLEVFLAFMRMGNMARVSERLSQSVVSVHRALHSLEEGVGCPLFKLDGRKLIPLQTAYTLAEYAERVVRECEEGLRRTRETAGFASPRLKIGSLYSLTVGTIPELLIKLKVRKSGLDVDLTLGSNRLLLELLSQGRLDAIVIALREEYPDDSLLSVPLFDDDIFFAAPEGSPYAHDSEIDLARLRDEKFVALDDEYATASNFSHAFQIAGYEPQLAMRVGDIFSLVNLVSGSVGYSLLPGRVLPFSPRIQLIPLAEKYRTRQTIALMLPKKRERDPNLLALAAECRMLGAARA